MLKEMRPLGAAAARSRASRSCGTLTPPPRGPAHRCRAGHVASRAWPNHKPCQAGRIRAVTGGGKR